MIPQRTQRSSSKLNIIFSVVFHTVIIVAVVFLAAKEGMLGNTMKQITVSMVPKPVEKKPEPVKPAETPKAVESKPAETPHMVAAAPQVQREMSAPPPVDAAPSVAPAAAIPADFEFNEGAHAVRTGDPVSIYKGTIEYALHSRWQRPDDMQDDEFVAEADVRIESDGQVSGYTWVKGSGNARWDNSVKSALEQTKAISSKPPKGFPSSFRVRFDVESLRTEDALQVSER